MTVDVSGDGGVTAARDLFISAMPHVKGAHANRTVAQLLKIYREYTGAPFTV